MSGTTYGFLVILSIFMLVKYREHTTKAALAIGQTARGGLQGISGRKGILWSSLALAVLALLWWLYQSDLTVTKLSEWVWGRLLFSLVVTGLMAVLLSCFDRTKWMWWIPAVILAGLLTVHWRNLPHNHAAMPTATPLASSSRASWSKVVIPAGEKSEDIPLPAGMRHIVVAGGKYQLYTVYADGHECHSFGSKTCPGGVVTKYYVVNEMQEMDTVLYAFVPK